MRRAVAYGARAAIVAGAALLQACGGDAATTGNDAARPAPVQKPTREPTREPTQEPVPAERPSTADAASRRERPPVPDAIPGPVDAAALDPMVRAAIEAAQDAVRAGTVEGSDPGRDAGARWLELADLLLAHGEPAGAAIAYTGALALLPERDDAVERASYLRAVALEDSGDSAAALAALEAIAPRSRTPQVHWRLALALAADGRLDEAIAAAQRATGLAPRDMRAQAALAQVASEAGAWEIAVRAARAGLDANPRNGHLYGILAASLRALGDESNEAERFTGAGRFSRADWLDPWLAALRDLRLGAGAARERFYEALRKNDAEAARRELDAFDGSGAQPARAALMRAQLAVSAGDAAGARAALAEAAGDGTTPCEVAVVRAMVDLRQAVAASTVASIVATLESTPCEGDQDATRLELVGNIRLAQGEFAGAAEALIAADEAREGGVGAAIRKAVVAMERAKAYGPATMLLDRLVIAEPLNPEPCFLLGVIALRSGDLDAAKRQAARLAELAPTNPKTRQLLEQIERAAGGGQGAAGRRGA
jgi:tetratricopeptide (TPR) repeat protein